LRFYYLCVFLAIFSVLPSCGYEVLKDDSSFSFRELSNSTVSLVGKRIHVYPFKNSVSEPYVEVIFTSKLIESLMRSSVILTDPDSADYIITGEVKNYSLSTMAMSRSGEIGVYRVTMGINIIIRDKNGKVLFNRMLDDYEDYQVQPTIEFTKAKERMAVETLSERIAQFLVIMLR